MNKKTLTLSRETLATLDAVRGPVQLAPTVLCTAIGCATRLCPPETLISCLTCTENPTIVC